MAWLLVHPQIHNIFSSLGVQEGNVYKVSDDCLEVLRDILKKLSMEDRTLRTFRRAIGFGQHIRKDLLPLLIHVKDDNKTTDATKIIDTIIKILVNLTIPIECLISTDALSKTDIGRHTIFDINKLLYTSKEAFMDFRSMKAVTDHIKFVIKTGDKLETEQCDSINNCLLLIRNILHVSEHRTQILTYSSGYSSMQNIILWNLFTQSIDKLLLNLMTFPQKFYWVVTIVQLIALMYKDQHIGSLQKLLNMMLEASLSDSSDDNESNTSPKSPNQVSGDSSPALTSDPTSDSSDNGGNGRNEKMNGKTQNDITLVNNICNQNIKQHVNKSQQNRNKILVTSQKQKSSDDSSSTSSHMSHERKQDVQQIPIHTVDNNMNYYMNAFRAQKRKLNQSTYRTERSNVPSISHNVNSRSKDNFHLQNELSDYGYGTQVENQESISTSSNDDEVPQQKPIHQKPHMVQKPRNKTRISTAPQDKKELRKKKFIKRSKINIIHMKGLLHHSPTDENISNILKEFTVDFLLQGYETLVHELYNQKLSNVNLEIDTSHIFWLITYFLKFATQLELEFEHIQLVLSFNVISYLTYEGVNLCEQLEISYGRFTTDFKPNLRRIHLVVTAIKEFLLASEAYKKFPHLSKEDEDSLTKLQVQIASTENLRNLFLLLIRSYNPEIQNKTYLQDLIVTNHILLLYLDKISDVKPKIEEHLRHFANVDVMQKYGYLLEDFENNGKYINDCIFTMMHHIGGDIDNVSTLFQPHILKTFSRMWESGYEMCDDWSDLIEYVIHKFINVPRQSSSNTYYRENLLNHSANLDVKQSDEWSNDDIQSLHWYYAQSFNEENIIQTIEKLYTKNGIANKTRIDIIKQLYNQNLINKKCHDNYMTKENKTENIKSEENQDHCELQNLKEQLFKENMGNTVLQLQKMLLEACHCYVIINNKNENITETYEPIPYCYIKLNLPIPIVPWTRENKNMLKNKTFVLLLHKLGFQLPIDTGKLYIRIPKCWTPNFLYHIAERLGPIDPESLKFDVKLLEQENLTGIKNELLLDEKNENTLPIMQYPLLLNTDSNWFHFQTILNKIKYTQNEDTNQILSSTSELTIPQPEIIIDEFCENANKIITAETIVETEDSEIYKTVVSDKQQVQENVNNLNEEIFEHNSICDTDSVTSDLTRMYVSDEEDKQ